MSTIPVHLRDAELAAVIEHLQERRSLLRQEAARLEPGPIRERLIAAAADTESRARYFRNLRKEAA